MVGAKKEQNEEITDTFTPSPIFVCLVKEAEC